MGFLAAAAPYLAIAGSAVTAFGDIRSGEAQAANARYQAQVAANNQVIAQQYSAAATKAGEANAYTQGLQNRQKLGALVAGQSASGIDINTGSSANVRVGEEENLYTDVERTRAQAALQAYGYNVEATNYGAQSQLYRAEAGQDLEAGFLKAGGTLLAGAGQLGGAFGANAATAAANDATATTLLNQYGIPQQWQNATPWGA